MTIFYQSLGFLSEERISMGKLVGKWRRKHSIELAKKRAKHLFVWWGCDLLLWWCRPVSLTSLWAGAAKTFRRWRIDEIQSFPRHYRNIWNTLNAMDVCCGRRCTGPFNDLSSRRRRWHDRGIPIAGRLCGSAARIGFWYPNPVRFFVCHVASRIYWFRVFDSRFQKSAACTYKHVKFALPSGSKTGRCKLTGCEIVRKALRYSHAVSTPLLTCSITACRKIRTTRTAGHWC